MICKFNNIWRVSAFIEEPLPTLMRKLLVFIVVLIYYTSYAQDPPEVEKKYVNELIYRYGNGFMKGTERLKFTDLEYEFRNSPDGLDAYMKAKQFRTTSTVFNVLGFVSTMVALSAIKSGNRNTAWIGLGGQIVFSILGRTYFSRSTQQTDRALWQRNKDVLFH
jgi:hypothetical protein